MRSVIHEAATLAKAVEQGWIKAGKPRNFSVKIFEEPEYALFGLITKKNAKVGIFVDDRRPQQQSHGGQNRRHAPSRRRFQHRYDRPQNGQGQQGPQRRQEQQQRPPEHHDEHRDNNDNDNNPIE